MRSALLLACIAASSRVTAQATPAVEITITARVLDADGAPIAGAGAKLGFEEELLTDDALRRPDARSDSDGSLRVTVTAGDRMPALLFAAPGKRAVLRRTTTTDLGDVHLLDGMMLAGRVHDAEGKPLADVRVRARDILDDSGRSIATTDARGQFALASCAPNCVELLFTKTGHYHRRLAPVGRTTPMSVAMTRSGMIRGRVLDADDRPSSGELHIAYEVTLDADSTIPVAADGSFAATLAHPTRFCLRSGDSVLSQVLQGPQDDLQLRAKPRALSRARVIQVRAVDGRTRLPVRALRAALTSALSLQMSAPQPAWLGADNDGCVAFPMPALRSIDDFRVMVGAAGYAVTTTMPIALDDASTPVVVALEPEAWIEGSVIDARSRKPIAACSVWAIACPDPSARIDYSTVPAAAVRTDVDGRFRIGSLGGGRHVVQAFTADYCAPTAIEATTKTGETLAGITVELEAAGELRGKLLDFAEPTSWMVVAIGGVVFIGAEGVRFLGPQPQTRRTVASDGSFVLTGVQPHPLRLHLESAAHTRFGPQLSFDLPDQFIAGRTEVTFAASDYGWGRVAGTLRIDDAATDLDRFVIVATPAEKATPFRLAPPLACVVAADGSYSLPLPCATYQLRLIDVSSSAEALDVENKVEVTAGTVTRVDLQPQWQAIELALEPRQPRDTVLVDHLRIERVGAAAPRQRHFALPGDTAWRAIRLEPGQRRVRLLLQAGAHDVVAYSESHQFGLGSTSETVLARRTIEVAGPQAFTVTVDPLPR